MDGEREVAGLLCSEVLASLSDYLDGELAAEARAAIEAHLAGCDRCARFGGGMAGALAALRAALVDGSVADDLDAPQLFARLRARIDDERARRR